MKSILILLLLSSMVGAETLMWDYRNPIAIDRYLIYQFHPDSLAAVEAKWGTPEQMAPIDSVTVQEWTGPLPVQEWTGTLPVPSLTIVTAIDTAGNESKPSNAISQIIEAPFNLRVQIRIQFDYPFTRLDTLTIPR